MEGSIEPGTLMEIDPSLTLIEIEANMPAEATFDHFIQSYIWVNRKLTCPEHYALATRRLLQQLAEQNVTYAEITLSAGMILWRGLDLAAVYDAIWSETRESGVQALWILDAVRQFGAETAVPVAEFAVAHRDAGVIAFGLGGYEERGPAEWFREVFEFAKDGGLHLVCHAGETVGPESIWAALEIGAQRIGHGIAAARDPALLETLQERNIPLEICISSNVCTGAIPALEAHPVRQIYDAGVPLILNTDDPALFRTDLCHEYEIAETVFGLKLEELAASSLKIAASTDRA
ncbi:MAG: adenosine deaminase family protein [Acidobacteriota bacterium]|nr:adenosine deaminase family protein [Acidobacteriota bacterium]